MNHRHLTLRQFRYFTAVAETGSVAAASRMLNIAQSAVTTAMLELEAELGHPLFERSSKGMLLTAQGHRFLVSARKVISSVADATRLHAAETGAGLSGVLTIGVTSLVAGYYLSELLSRFRRHSPAVEVLITEETPQFLEHLLINGELDVAIMVSNVLGEPQALLSETLTGSPNRVWLASNHPLAAREELTLAECAQRLQLANDSGNSKGQRRVQRRRFEIRRALCMSTLIASRYNPAIKTCYQRLLAAAKLPTVALVPCMRKLRPTLNAMVKTTKP